MTRRGEFRSIHTSLVHDPDFQALTPGGKLIFYTIKLQLGPSGIGPFYVAILPEQTGLNTGEVKAALEELEAGDWIKSEGNIYWIRNGLKFEPQMSLNDPKHKSCILSHLDSLPRLEIVGQFRAYYGLEEEGEEKTATAPLEPEVEEPDPIRDEFTAFCNYFTETTGREVREKSEARLSAYRARRHNWSDEELRAGLVLASRDDYLRGRGNGSSKDYLSLDYILRPDKCEQWITASKSGARPAGAQLMEELT